jgi:ferredoxin
MPLAVDKPIEFGVWDFCSKCKKCAQHCPSGAISDGEPTTQGQTVSNSPGARKWYLNPEKCLKDWITNNTFGCSDCIRVCAYNKKPGVWVDELAVSAGASGRRVLRPGGPGRCYRPQSLLHPAGRRAVPFRLNLTLAGPEPSIADERGTRGGAPLG